MPQVQVVCKNTRNVDAFEQRLREVFGRFHLADRSEVRSGHILLNLDDHVHEADRILLACREVAYAYLRFTEWERGGALEATSDATCVAGLGGQPLRPIVVRILGQRANLEHALFQSRSGLMVANVRRRGNSTTVLVKAHRIRELKIETPEVLLDDTFEQAPQEWLTDLQTRMDLDCCLALVRATLRKAECVFCAHCHYREVDERRET